MKRFTQPAFAGRIGIVRRDVTPPAGIYARNWGASRHDRAEGVHRPLTATAVAFQTDGPPLVLIAMDADWWKLPEDEWLVRGGVLEATGLDPARVIVALSHTHSGPSICSRDSSLPGGELIPEYLMQVRETLAEAAKCAIFTQVSGTLTSKYAHCSLATDRSFPDPENPRLVCGFNPDANPDGTLLAGRIVDGLGCTLGTLVNYACHGTTLGPDNRLISTDFPGAMRELLEDRTGAPCAFLQGASGDLAPREQYVAETAVADTHGRELGYAVLAALEGMLPPRTALEYRGIIESGAVLADWQTTPCEPSRVLEARCVDVELPLKELPTLEGCDERVLAERRKRQQESRAVVGDGPTSKVPLWVWRVGDHIFVAQPNELFSAFQVELRRRFPDLAIAVMNCANGAEGGYLAPACEYDRDRYETWQTPYARGSYEAVLEAAVRTVQELA